MLKLLLAVSGASALIGQLLFCRAAALLFGSTLHASSLTLAIFMAGLALGSHAARRLNLGAPLRGLALAELGMGLATLSGLGLLFHLASGQDPLAPAWLPSNLEWLARAALAAGLGMPATFCSGLTIPLAMEHLERSGADGRDALPGLYAVNTLGALAGALACALWLLPSFGVPGGLAACVALNGVGAWLAWSLHRSPSLAPPPKGEGGPARVFSRVGGGAGSPGRPWNAATLAWTALLSGAAAFLLEVLWSRTLNLIIGSSTFAFTWMLSAVLLGILLGSASLRPGSSPARLPRLFLYLFFLTLATAALAGWLPDLSFHLMRGLKPDFLTHQVLSFGLCLPLILPVAFLQGRSFPLLAHLAESRGAELGGRLYAYNTLGAVLGALAGGFLVVPTIGVQAAYPLAAALFALCALILAWPGLAPAWRPLLAVGLFSAAALGPLFFRPWDKLVMSSGVYLSGVRLAKEAPSGLGLRAALRQAHQLLFYEEGLDATVAVRQSKDNRSLTLNGKVDASSKGDQATQKLLAHLPLAFKPGAKDAYIIGWGSGSTAGAALLHPLAELRVAEIEPAVLKTASLFEEANRSALRDPRLRVAPDDARHDLRSSPRKWDVLIAEPSNPWIRGVANLFTREFFALVRSRLQPGGLYCQWVHYYGLRGDELKLIIRTLLSVFPNVGLFAVPPEVHASLAGDLLLLAGEAPLDARGLAWPAGGALGADLRSFGLGDARDLLALNLAGHAALGRLAGKGPLNTDLNPRLEFGAPRGLYQAMLDDQRRSVAQFTELELAEPDPLPPLLATSGAAPGPELLLEFGRRYNALSQFHRAAASLRAARARGSLDPSLPFHLGKALFFTMEMEQAQAELQDAIRLAPRFAPAYESLAMIQVTLKRPAQALETYQAMAKRLPKSAEAFYGQAHALGLLGRLEEARAALKRSLELDPGSEKARQGLARIEAAARR